MDFYEKKGSDDWDTWHTTINFHKQGLFDAFNNEAGHDYDNTTNYKGTFIKSGVEVRLEVTHPKPEQITLVLENDGEVLKGPAWIGTLEKPRPVSTKTDFDMVRSFKFSHCRTETYSACKLSDILV